MFEEVALGLAAWGPQVFMSSVGVAGGPEAPGAGESHARAARGAWKGSRGRALCLFPGTAAVIGEERDPPKGPAAPTFIK